MAYDKDQIEFPLPGNEGPGKRRSEQHLPRFFRTEKNSKFLYSTLDQLLQPGQAEKVNGYFGRKTAPGYSADDNYVGDISKQRETYQFEPSTVIKDNIGNVTWHGDYPDFVNQIANFGGLVNQHNLTNSEEFYSWSPNINWDMFTNFREYYWLPMGPQTVDIRGDKKEITSTYTVSLQDDGDSFSYIFTPDGLTPNPTLKLYRGVTYRFEINTPGHPLSFRTARTLEDQFLLKEGIPTTGAEIDIQNVENGVITLTLNENTPNELFFVSSEDINVGGLIQVANQSEASQIDVEAEIIGKKAYTSENGVTLSNGMKIRFQGDVSPAKYKSSEWFVEGVGDKIVLMSTQDLEVSFPVGIDFFVPFDNEEFGFDNLPFGTSVGYPRDKDYITINRSSSDGNFWSRYNRWFHKDVIEKSAELNGQSSNLDQNARANRPIIEFNAGLKLFNFGTKSKQAIDLIDNYTTDAFSTIEGSIGYNIDGVNLTEGMRVLFLKDTDSLVTGRIFEVKFIPFSGSPAQITLVEASDSLPLDGDTVIAVRGEEYSGSMWFYNGTQWKRAQEKTSVNQPPLFDVFDIDGNSFSDTTVYPINNFKGTKLFSYKEGTGVSDSILGFPLTYRSIENVGDIVFDFNFSFDSFEYQIDNTPLTVDIKSGVLRKYDNTNNFKSVGVWTKASDFSTQEVITQYVNDGTKLRYEINCYDKSANIEDLIVRVFVNGNLVRENIDYIFETTVEQNLAIKFTKNIANDSNIVIKTDSKSSIKNSNGYFDIPPSLERNPKNEDVTQFTLGEVIDHTKSIITAIPNFEGTFPGTNNLRDLSDTDKYGRKFIKHSSPFNLSTYHILDRDSNVIKAIRYAKNEYAKFKREFITVAETLGFEGPIKVHVDKILTEINKDKVSDMPFYFSDMVPYGAAIKTEVVVEDVDIDFFALSFDFDFAALSRRAVNVYLNGTQLLYGRDYTFNENSFLQITVEKQFGDIIEIYQYETTNGCYIPPTPTKLGLYPKFEPRKYLDNTYLEPTEVIEGHDGSIIKCYHDFRDDLLLELEKRIFNNIKMQYDPNYVDINDYVGGIFRNTNFTREQINRPMITDFVNWNRLVEANYTENFNYDRDNSFTYNYGSMISPSGTTLPGNWRAIFKEMYDTDRPHTAPWEMLGFTIRPDWWEAQYGPAPYTSENILMWEDLRDGIIRDPSSTYKINKKYERPDLLKYIPVDSDGNLKSPNETNIPQRFDTISLSNPWKFGDQGPVETAWRKSSEFPFALIASWVINQPARIFATGFDRSRQVRNQLGQLVYKTTNNHIRLEDIEFPNTFSDSVQISTAGLINYISNYMTSSVTSSYEQYKENLQSIKNMITLKVGGFTDKDKFRLILDSRTPLNKGNVFVPEENYQIFLNTSRPISVFSYSGVIVEKSRQGFIIRGYDQEQPTFKYYDVIRKGNDPVINIGGITEKFIEWDSNSTFVEGTNVRYNENYYRVLQTHTTSANFDATKYARLPALPIIGGRDAIFSKTFFKDDIREISYGTLIPTIQGVVDFLLGYGSYLESIGFSFEYFDADNKIITDWETSAKEFLFWTTQNWGEGTVLTLSPAANEVKFKADYAVVDNVFDTFFGYSLLKADGKKLVQEFTRIARQNPNEFVLRPVNTADGIFAIKIATIQKEHVILIDNFSVFGDVIYDQPAGYRQERIKVLGYRTAEWDGSINIPGFLYDSANVTEWESWKDYSIGDLVKYKEFYYTASSKIAGDESFQTAYWTKLNNKPEAGLITNFEYKVNQFADFYDLDSDNFDVKQQATAQHLIGYQKRDYLENIINDEVSQYKFYQGYIADKGTLNSLTKLFDVLGSARKESLEFYEEWAIKKGQYGASDSYHELELIIDESKVRLTPQPFQLVNRTTNEETDLVYRYKPYEVEKKPIGYNSAPFPVTTNTKNYTRDTGYVNQEDVKFIVTDYQEIFSLPFNDVDQGNYIWVGQKDNTWNVLQQTVSDYVIKSIIGNREAVALDGPGKNQFEVVVDKLIEDDIQVGDIIGLYDIIVNSPQDPDDSAFDVVKQSTELLEGWFTVLNKELNRIIIRTDSAIDNISECRGLITIFKSARTSTLQEANRLAENGIEKNDIIWVDNDGVDWTVLKINKPYDLLQKIASFEQGNNAFGEAIAVDSRNILLAVGSPKEDYKNGTVALYSRGSNNRNYQFLGLIEPNKNIADAQINDLFPYTSQQFGKALAVSPDAKYVFVGSPTATNIRTRYRGEFNPIADYQNGESVKYNENIWEAVVDIKASKTAGEFEGFSSILEVYSENNIFNNEFNLNSVVVGNFPIPEVETDHILVRAPADAYNASDIGDTVYLDWYRQTSALQKTLFDRAPFGGVYEPITEEWIEKSDGHKIKQKVDAILYVDAVVGVPEIDEQIEIPGTVFGYVAYTFRKENRLTIYVKDSKGKWPLTGTFQTEQGINLGNFARVAPQEDENELDLEDTLGGYWYINVSTIGKDSVETFYPYTTSLDFFEGYDEGRQLAIVSVVPENQTVTNTKLGANILDYKTDEVQSNNNEYALIRTLTTQGFPGVNRNSGVITSDLWMVRAPTVVSDQLEPGDTVGVNILEFPNLETGLGQALSVTGLNYPDTNKQHTLYDVWDGYINVTLARFDDASRYIEPRIDQYIRDNRTGARAQIAFFTRDGTSVTLYLKNSRGRWSYGSDFGENEGTTLLVFDTQDPNPIYANDVTDFANIRSTSMGNEELGIGKLLVFKLPAPITALPIQNSLTDKEYIVYKVETLFGRAIPPNVPSGANFDWKIVNKILANPDGEVYFGQEQGLINIFERGGANYDYVGSFLTPDKKDYFRFGSDIKVAKSDQLYKVFVQAKGNDTLENPGRIYFIKHGTDQDGNTFYWDFGKDEKFKGEFAKEKQYQITDIVFLDGVFYQAVTINAPGYDFDPTEWQALSDTTIDFLGYIPNDTSWVLNSDSSLQADKENLIQFGRAFDIDEFGEVLVTSARYSDQTQNRVLVYRYVDVNFAKYQEIEFPRDNIYGLDFDFGTSIALSRDGEFLAIGAKSDSDDIPSEGVVFVYKINSDTLDYELFQELRSTKDIPFEFFGNSLQFDNDILYVGSTNAPSKQETSFDTYTQVYTGNLTFSAPLTSNPDSVTDTRYVNDPESVMNDVPTTFDNGYTTFANTVPGNGTVYAYQRINDVMVFGQEIDFDDRDARVFGRNIVASANHLYCGLPEYPNASTRGLVLDYRRSTNDLIERYRTPKARVDLNKIKKVILFDNDTNSVIESLDYIDPIQGKIAGPADQEILYKTIYDPATYNTNNGVYKVNQNQTDSWGEEQVGQVWWDLTNAKLFDPYQGNLLYSVANWNTLFPGASIDIYEWVKSPYPPSEWDEISQLPEAGIRRISGISKYSDNAYVVKKEYDSIAKSFTNYYYFWVKDKITVPDLENRTLSVSDIKNLINDPASQGYKYITFINESSFVLTNCESVIKGNDVSLNIQYWINKGQESNIHNEYQLVTEGLGTSKPGKDIEQKWFDSLVGYDNFSREVPDPTLSKSERYGILNRPRQGWFVNRIEALKQVIERVNAICKVNQIVDSKNLNRLYENDTPPLASTNLYDTVVDTEIDLQFIGVAKARSASITPILSDGKIVRLVINDKGRGYLTPPTYKIKGTGSDAELSFTIDRLGSISSVEIVNQGSGYDANTRIEIRPFTALVRNDQTIGGRWALYERSDTFQTWGRIVSQAYDTGLYWEFLDWYATGYNDFIQPDFIIEQSYELDGLDDQYGDIIKILNVGADGGWLLLRKIDDLDTTDYSVNYETIGKENGTIKFKDSLYNFTKSQVGFDAQSFDTKYFDSQPVTEIRIILETIRDYILVNDLEEEYNKLFFASLRYVFSEQGYVDWAFKTSFIKARHNVGDLTQKVTFQNDNLPSFEKYIEEVKPYKTKIREYISDYDRIEDIGNSVTDFDLPPKYDETSATIRPKVFKVVNGIISGNEEITTYPDKHWYDNLAYKITDVQIADAGSGYLSAPIIRFESTSGSGAEAVASLGPGGSISNIFITNPGSGYTAPPTLIIDGAIADGGRPATASVFVGEGLVRNAYTVVKFDRITGSYIITNLGVTQRFEGTGTRTKFDLKFPMDLRTNVIEVSVNGELILPGQYAVNNELNLDKSYRRYTGYVDLLDAPPNESVVEINYRKDVSMLSAADRINLFYTPTDGQFGKELGQLMDGVDYGGVQVKSFRFTETSGWDNDEWYNNIWDGFEETYSEESFVADGSTTSYELSRPLEAGVTYNVYINGVRIDDDEFDGTTPLGDISGKELKIRAPIVGDGVTTTITFEDVELYERAVREIVTNQEDPIVITVRRSTSDGSFAVPQESYDTALTGGDLAYTTATGLKAEDITVDGDGFVTVTTSKGPEEVVPGQVMDTLDITVYERPGSGSSIITSRNYVGDGSTTSFDIGEIPVSEESIFIKIDNEIIKDPRLYKVDYNNTRLVFWEAPQDGQRINIVTMSTAGDNLLDYDEFIGDGTTQEFLTRVDYTTSVRGYITVNGEAAGFELLESDNNYAYSNSVVIRFAEAPAKDAVIQYSLFNSIAQSYSQVIYDEFISDGITNEYVISKAPFNNEPVSYFTVVTVNDRVLKPGYNEQFTGQTGVLEYPLKKWQIPVGTISGADIEVYVNDRKLEFLKDYTFEGAAGFNPNIAPDEQIGSTVIMNRGVVADGDLIRVHVLSDGEYRFGYFSSTEDSTGVFVSTPKNLQLDYVGNDGDIIRVYQFSNHDAQGIERLTYDVIERTQISVGTDDYYEFRQMRNGLIRLRKPAISSAYIWVILNGEWLNPTEDYILTENKNYIKFIKPVSEGDSIDIIQFSGSPVSNKFAWRQFKDILNRNIYKRLDGAKITELVEPLRYYDKTITVADATNLPDPKDPKAPGIIYIASERIEFLRREGNVLKQIRRGTLGTSTPPIHEAGTKVIDQSADTTAPYRDQEEIVNETSESYFNASEVYTNSDEVTFTGITYNFNNNTAFPVRVPGVFEQEATVKGTGFRPQVRVYVGNTLCETTYINSTTLTFAVPGLKIGSYDLVIVNPAETDPLPRVQTSLVVPKIIPYVQILLPFAPIPNPVSEPQWNGTTGWYKEQEIIGVASMTPQRGYIIESLGNTDWSAFGVANAKVGTEFVTKSAADFVQFTGTGTVKNFSSIPYEYWEAQDIEVFVGGKRLRKSPVQIFDPELDQDSPEGDIYLEAEYAVNKAIGAYVRLTSPPDPNTNVTVVKRTGKLWSAQGERIVESETETAVFMRGKSIDLPR